MTNLPIAKQVTALSKALSTHTAVIDSQGFFSSIWTQNDDHEGEANLIYISIHIFMSCVVFVLKAR